MKKFFVSIAALALFLTFGACDGKKHKVEDEEDKELVEDSTATTANDVPEATLPTPEEIKRDFKEEYSEELARLNTYCYQKLGCETCFMDVPGTDYEVMSVNISNITDITETTAKAIAVTRYGELGSERATESQTNHVSLVLEKGKWVIDDFDGYKARLQGMIGQTKKQNADEATGTRAINNRDAGIWQSIENGYGVFGDVLHRRLNESDLSDFDSDELRVLRNTVYARHGYIFKSKDLQDYFAAFSWYTPVIDDGAAVFNLFSEIEKYNIEFIKRHE